MLYVRIPVAAGTFYDLDKTMLEKQIEVAFRHKLGPFGEKKGGKKKEKAALARKDKEKIVAAVVPHAGYVYSGAVAAWVYSRIEDEKTNFIIIGPNHTGIGADFAVMPKGLWKTPLGGVAVDEKAAGALLEDCKLLSVDYMPHAYEHSIEVQLPFLQHRFGSSFKLIPICVKNEAADETLLEACRAIGKSIAKAVKASKDKWFIIASSDFSHYVPHELAAKNDDHAIKAILKLDEGDFFSRVNAKGISICGFGPIAIAMAAAKSLGAKKGKLLRYATSGNTTGSFESVVGYAAITFS
jgi:AmmeMemoRadiSam system protein B